MINLNDIIVRGKGRMWLEDITLLYKTANEIAAKNLLEIGAMDGCSSMTLGAVAKQYGGQLYSIEPKPTGLWRQNIKELSLSDYITLIHGKSPWVFSDQVATPLDYLFIDGDHRTRWCLADYHFWAPFVRQGGRIAFHDWSAMKGVQESVQRAVAIILETDNLIELCRSETKDRGIIIFEKAFFDIEQGDMSRKV